MLASKKSKKTKHGEKSENLPKKKKIPSNTSSHSTNTQKSCSEFDLSHLQSGKSAPVIASSNSSATLTQNNSQTLIQAPTSPKSPPSPPSPSPSQPSEPMKKNSTPTLVQKPSLSPLSEPIPKKPSLLIEASLKPVPFVAPQLVFESQRNHSSTSPKISPPETTKKKDSHWKRKTIALSTSHEDKEKEKPHKIRREKKEKRSKDKKEKEKKPKEKSKKTQAPATAANDI